MWRLERTGCVTVLLRIPASQKVVSQILCSISSHVYLYTLTVIRLLHDELNEFNRLSMQNCFCLCICYHRVRGKVTLQLHTRHKFSLRSTCSLNGMTTPWKDMHLSIKQLYSKGSSQIHCKFNAYSNSKNSKECKRETLRHATTDLRQ